MPIEQARLLLGPDGEPVGRIVGIETESSVLVEATEGVKRYLEEYGGAYERGGDASTFVNVHVFGEKKDIYTDDGNREYLDLHKPEVSTAEETSFSGAALRVARGHIKMARRYEEALPSINEELKNLVGISGRTPIKQLIIIANNCTPNLTAAWGSHENYQTRRALTVEDDIFPAFVTHNVSRIVWSGIGLVVRGEKSGEYGYALSERAEFLEEEYGGGSLEKRALVNTRDEALANREYWRRYHDVSGETTMNPYTTALRLAAGSILLRACELGVDFSDLMPHNPIFAMRKISHDTTLTKSIPLENGEQFTALDLQEAIAQRAIYHAEKAGYLTTQEQLWGQRWLSLIDSLKKDPRECSRMVDWVFKQSLIERELDRPRKDHKTDYDIALRVATAYHSVLPSGLAIKAMRKGFYALNPTDKELDEGLPLPNTRAMLRVSAIKALREAGINFTANWMNVRVENKENLLFGDPSATTDDNLDRLLASL